jgi:hypothetical protein
MSILKLLEGWSELEPERCNHQAGMFVLRGWSILYDPRSVDRLTLAEIQSAVQDAVEERDWNWYLDRILIEQKVYYKGRVAIPSASDAINRSLSARLSTHSAAYALLLAYLHTLDVVRNKSFRKNKVGKPDSDSDFLSVHLPPLYPE